MMNNVKICLFREYLTHKADSALSGVEPPAGPLVCSANTEMFMSNADHIYAFFPFLISSW